MAVPAGNEWNAAAGGAALEAFAPICSGQIGLLGRTALERLESGIPAPLGKVSPGPVRSGGTRALWPPFRGKPLL